VIVESSIYDFLAGRLKKSDNKTKQLPSQKKKSESMEILTSMAIIVVTTIFILLSFALYLTIRIFTGKSRNDKRYTPIHATIFDLFFHSHKLYDYETEIARTKPTFRFLSPGQSEIFTADPRNVEHILKTRFHNYSKGPVGTVNLADLLGHGIFAVDGEKWKQQRKLVSFEFSTRVLRNFSYSVFRTSASKLVGFIAEFALSGKSFDFQVRFETDQTHYFRIWKL